MAGGVRLRAARTSDLDGLEALERTLFPGDRLSRRSLRRYVATPTARLIVAEAGAGRIQGYALVAFRRGSSLARLYSIAVAAPGRGIGRALLAAAEGAAIDRGCRALRLEARADNARALALYDRNGYSRIGTTPRYYEDGATALRCEKPLTRAGATRDRRAGCG